MTGSVLEGRFDKAYRKRERADQNEANGPGRIQIEPAPRHKLETQVAVDQPRQAAAGRDHRHSVDDGDKDGHADIGLIRAATASWPLSRSAERQRPRWIGSSQAAQLLRANDLRRTAPSGQRRSKSRRPF
jgi:hypothetical protein